MLTAPSSAIVISLEPKQWQKGEFEAWRETASRGALADPCISHAAKSAFHFILWHVNREKGGWTLSWKPLQPGQPWAASGMHDAALPSLRATATSNESRAPAAPTSIRSHS
jgi:hypothetical protein